MNDYISREEAIENLKFQNEKFFGGQSKSLKMVIAALSAEGEYIKKEDALSCFTWQNTKEDVWFAIKDLPTISISDSTKNKGEWKEKYIEREGYCYFCSNCNLEIPEYSLSNFCPNCGAKMEGSKE